MHNHRLRDRLSKTTHSQRWLLLIISTALLCLAIAGTEYFHRSTRTNPGLPAATLTAQEFDQAQHTLTDLLKTDGLAAAFAYAHQQLASNPAFARSCHPLMHHLGHDALTSLGDFSTAMSQADELCNSGFVHGLIEARFMTAPSIDGALATTCPKDTAHNFPQWQCFHGVGHGVMYATNKDVGTSLAFCATLPDSFAQRACTNGVFMERFIIVSHTGEHTAHSAIPDLKTCQTQPEPFKDDCYTYAPSAFLELRPNRYSEALQWCHQSEKNYVLTCTNGVGAQVMKENITNPSFAALFCQGLSSLSVQNSCARGAVSLYMNHYSSVEKAALLCDGIFKTLQHSCHETIASGRKLFSS